jgi:predicted SAM-dependent methyltransferase
VFKREKALAVLARLTQVLSLALLAPRKVHGRLRARQLLKRTPGPHRLHVGCGPNRFPGWIHLDGNRLLRGIDIYWDLSLGLPFPDDSLDSVYSEHVLEHLEVADGVRYLAECRRVLKPRGVVRTAMPSLEAVVGSYVAEDWKAGQDWLTWPEYRFIDTRAEMLNISMRWWEHRWLYDREELHRRHREAGFHRISDLAWGESDYPHLVGRETRKDSRLICEAVKE